MTETKSYAASVVEVLREHFPDLTDPTTAEAITDLIERHARNPQDPFDVIVDDPIRRRGGSTPTTGSAGVSCCSSTAPGIPTLTRSFAAP